MTRPSSGSVRHLPSGQWQARVSHLGRQLAIGSFVTRHEALDAIAQASGDEVHGRLFDPARGRVKLETAVERWWQTRVGHRVSTRARDRMVLDRHVLPTLGSAQLFEVTHDAATLAAAERIADLLASDLSDPATGALFGSTKDPDAVGVFAQRRVPFEDNVVAIRLFARLATVGHDERRAGYRALAERVLEGISRPEDIHGRGRMIGDYLLAIEDVKRLR